MVDRTPTAIGPRTSEALAAALIGRRPHARLRLAERDYLSGRYDEAIGALASLVAGSQLHPMRRSRARRLLSLAYYQTNRFAAAAELPLQDPLTRMMRSAAQPLNQVGWHVVDEARLPFLQNEPWELPSVSVTVGDQRLSARIDTGGDLFSLPWELADRLGVVPVATAVGRFAGGRRARIGYGFIDRLDLGGATIDQVPISINSFDHPVIGTGVLRQFQPTLDFPNGQLVLRPRNQDPLANGFPFVQAATHFLVARAAVNGWTTNVLIDSGLEVTNTGCFLAPNSTLRKAGIEIPAATPVEGVSGAGETALAIGEFPVASLALGNREQSNVVGLTGVFPSQLAKRRTLGFPLGGLVSHNFLRHYRWTLDFGQMRMQLATP